MAFTITWTIENYSFCDKRNGCYFLSPKFTAEHFGGSEWNILLYPRGLDIDSYENLCMHIWRVPFENVIEEMFIDFNVEIYSADGDIFMKSDKKIHVKTGCEYSFPKGLKTEDIEKKMARSPKDTLIVHVRMEMVHSAGKTAEKECSAKTTIDFDKYSFTLDFDYEYSSDILMKRTFLGMNGTEFEVTIKAPEDDVLIEIRRTRENSRRNPAVKCHIFLIDCEGMEILSKGDFFFFNSDYEEMDTWNFPSFFKKTLISTGLCDSIKLTFFASNGIKIHRTYSKDDTSAGSSTIKV